MQCRLGGEHKMGIVKNLESTLKELQHLEDEEGEVC